MTTLSIPQGTTFDVISASAIRYNDQLYNNVTSITIGGEVKTLAEIIEDHGGAVYSESELRQVVKVELIDPDTNGRQIATMYSTNSRNVGKNATASIPGGAWVEMFNFRGDYTNNHVLAMFREFGVANGQAGQYTFPGPVWEAHWLGFKINYGVNAAHSYVMTWVNDFLEESQPCPPSDIGVPYLFDAKLTGRFRPPGYITDGQGEAHFFAPIRYFRLYRGNTTQAGQTVYQRVPVEPVSVAPNVVTGAFPHALASVINPPPDNYGFTITDTVNNDQLLEVLPSIDWSPPPYRAMKGLIAWRNGIMAAFNGNTMMFCEPYRPFAWPTIYYVALPHEIVAVEVDQNSLIVLTTAEPYIFSGTHPKNVSYERLEEQQAGLRANEVFGHRPPSRAITATAGGVLYASAEGPVLISGGRAQMLGRSLFTRKEWRERYFQGFGTLRLAYYDGHVVGYFADSDLPGFKLALADAGSQLVKFIPPARMLGDFQNPADGSLHVITRGATSTVARFADEFTQPLNASYHTREVHLATPENLGALELRGYGGAVTVEVFQNTATAPYFTRTLILGGSQTSRAATRLPANIKAHKYSVRLTFGAFTVIRELHLASTMRELANA